MKTINLLQSFESVEQAIITVLQASRSQVRKRSKLKSKQLKASIARGSELLIPSELFNFGHINPCYEGEGVNIIFEDDNFLVFDKPCGIHCHPLHYAERDNILSFMREKGLGKLLEVNQESYDRGLIHRLDFATSGVLIYCKTMGLFKEIFSRREQYVLEKNYIAKTNNLKISPGHYVHFIEERNEKVIMHDESHDKFEKVELVIEANQSGFLEIALITGKRHQIRSQLASLGAPIVGDELYGGEKSGRLHLHALSYKLKVRDQEYYFKSKLPNW